MSMLEPNDSSLVNDNNTGKTKVKSPKIKSKWRWLKNLLRFIFYILFLVIILIVLILWTPLGTKTAIQAVNRFVPIMNIDYKSGSIAKDLNLNKLSLSIPNMHLNIEDLELKLNTTCLLYKIVCVDKLNASTVAYSLDTSSFKPKPETTAKPNHGPIELPINIFLTSDLNNIDIKIDEMQFKADNINLKANWLKKGISVDYLVSNGIGILLEPQKIIQVSNAKDFKITKTPIYPFIVQPIFINEVSSKITKSVESKYKKLPKIKPKVIDYNNIKTITNTFIVSNLPPSSLVNLPKLNLYKSASKQINKKAIFYKFLSGVTEFIPHSSDIQPEKLATQINNLFANFPQIQAPMSIYIKKANLTNNLLIVNNQRVDKFANINLKASWVDHKILIDTLDITHTDGNLNLGGDITLNKSYLVDLNLNAHINQLPDLAKFTQFNHQDLQLTIKGDFNDLSLDIKGDGDLPIVLKANAKLLNANLPYSITVTSPSLKWPFVNPTNTINDLDLNFTGNIDYQTLKVSLDANVDKLINPAKININIKNDLKNFKLYIDDIKANGKFGEVSIKGDSIYADKIAWDLALKTESFELNKLIENTLQSLLAGNIHTTGFLSRQAWNLTLEQSELKGSLNKMPLKVKGYLTANSNLEIYSKDLELTANNSTILLNGQTKDKWDLAGVITVPNLHVWNRDLKGSIKANIKTSGPLKDPLIELDANIKDFDFADNYLQNVKIKGSYEHFNQNKFALNLKSSPFKINSSNFDSVTLNTLGNLYAQDLYLDVKGDVGVNTHINGFYNPNSTKWSGIWSNATISSKFGPARMQNPTFIEYTINSASGALNPLCFIHVNGTLCSTKPVELANKGSASLTFDATLGKLLRPILPEEINWIGKTKLVADAAWSPDNKPTADVKLNIDNGSINYKPYKNILEFPYKSIDVKASINDSQVALDMNIDAHELLKLTSNVKLDVDPNSRKLNGFLNINKITLNKIQPLLPILTTLNGVIKSDVKIGGTLTNPALNGTVKIIDTNITSIKSQTSVKNLNFNIDFKDQNSKINGDWLVGKGKAHVDGNVSFENNNITGQINLVGKNLNIEQAPIADVLVNNNITLKFDPKLINVTGTLSVPEGRITIPELASGGVSKSKDVVFANEKPKAQVVASNLSMDIDVNVGDKLKIEGMGLIGKLEGKLKLKQDIEKPLMIYGDIEIKDGEYKFMGQKLIISKSLVQFVGPPSIPTLDIEAIREIKAEDLVAGVKVTGTAERPIVALFSNPIKEQAEILSYILKGEGFSSTNNNSSLMMSAALTLTAQSGGVSSGIGSLTSTATNLVEDFGFNNVQIDTNDDGKIAISGYIGKKLMLKYGVGVFTPGFETTVRYYLLSKLYTEFVSSTVGQTLDIYYGFDIK